MTAYNKRTVAYGEEALSDLDVESVAMHADWIQLLVVGHERARGIKDLVGPPGYASGAKQTVQC